MNTNKKLENKKNKVIEQQQQQHNNKWIKRVKKKEVWPRFPSRGPFSIEGQDILRSSECTWKVCQARAPKSLRIMEARLLHHKTERTAVISTFTQLNICVGVWISNLCCRFFYLHVSFPGKRYCSLGVVFLVVVNLLFCFMCKFLGYQ